jgi:phenylalanyl-tRNA synthetase beta chain
MNISYKWLKKFVDVDYSPSELDHILTMLGIEVESIIDFGKKYDKFVTAKVLEKEKHPNADKLSVCRVSTGKEELTVVCGAPNVAAGQSVVLGLPGAVVPQSGIKLEKRAVRKIESNGMICSQSELELSEDHSGIWVLPEDTPPGIPLSEFLDIDDIIFEISVTPNRADCLSHLGIAREIAAYSRQSIKMPEINITETGLSLPRFPAVG